MNVIKKINRFGWADWGLNECYINSEKVFVKLSYYTGDYNRDGTLKKEGEREVHATINCNNFIGFSLIGHWDESTIEDIRIEPKGDLITNSLQEVKRLYGDPPFPLGMGVMSIDGPWHQLNIKLIDGNIVKVACQSFNFECFECFECFE